MRQYAKSRTGARLLDGQDLFFFFQAEDGIRDYKVTGVQTCALPICLEDRVQGELAGRVAPSDDVAELVARERTEHLSGGNLGVVDQRAVLRVRLTAVYGDAQLDVADGDVVVRHEDVGEACRVEPRVGRLPHAIVPRDLRRQRVGRSESGAAVVRLCDRDVWQRQAREREHAVGRGDRSLLRADRPVAVTAAGRVIGPSYERRRGSAVVDPPRWAAPADARWTRDDCQ